jgi:hypothetical protein
MLALLHLKFWPHIKKLLGRHAVGGGGAALGEWALIAFGLAFAGSERREQRERCFQLIWIAADDACDRADETLNGSGRIGRLDEPQSLENAATSRVRERGRGSRLFRFIGPIFALLGDIALHRSARFD